MSMAEKLKDLEAALSAAPFTWERDPQAPSPDTVEQFFADNQIPISEPNRLLYQFMLQYQFIDDLDDPLAHSFEAVFFEWAPLSMQEVLKLKIVADEQEEFSDEEEDISEYMNSRLLYLFSDRSGDYLCSDLLIEKPEIYHTNIVDPPDLIFTDAEAFADAMRFGLELYAARRWRRPRIANRIFNNREFRAFMRERCPELEEWKDEHRSFWI